jgi:GxxExxY protein
MSATVVSAVEEQRNMTRNIEGEFDGLSQQVIGCALEVHTQLGPGLLESAYEQCLAHELRSAGLNFELQRPLPVAYKGVLLDCGYRLDIVVEDRLIAELKSVDALLPIHEAQLLTYLKLARIPVGLLINFNVVHLRDGIRRKVLNYRPPAASPPR